VVTVGLLISGAGGILLPSAAANAASARPPAGLHHVSPFGTGAARAARPQSRGAAPPPAAAVTPSTVTTRWVSNTVALGTNASCASPGYATISDALAAAAPGDIIKVCAGTYNEQLVITQSVTLKTVGAVTVIGPASPASPTLCDADGGGQPNQDVVDICGTGSPGSISVTILGFTFQGNWPTNVCNNSLYGVAVLGGASLAMSSSTVKNIGGDPLTDGCQGGVGIQVGLAMSSGPADTGTATLSNVTVTGYQKNGITVDGTGSNAKITAATVTGAGPTTAIAQNGIQVSDGATSTISGSTISGNECNHPVCGSDGFTQTQSTGILAFDSGKTTVSSSNVYGNDLGVYNLEDYAWAYYTPPTPFVPVPVSFRTMTLANRYENAGFDEGQSSLTSSSLSGGGVGIEVFQYSGDGTSPRPTATGNTITGATDAILVASTGASGLQAVKLTATKNSFDTSNGAGVVNQSTSIINVTNDWWGDATGPSVWSFGTGSSVSSDVNFFPWATDPAFAGTETCAISASQSTTGSDVVLCAPAGTANAFLQNAGSGNVLLIGNNGNDQLVGTSSSAGETWMIGGRPGHNAFNGSNGHGYIQERANPNDTVIHAANYTIATK
jgi:hypothetical protein